MTSLQEKEERRQRAKKLMHMLDRGVDDTAAMLALVEAGVDFRYRNSTGAQCLTMAVDKGSFDLVKALVEKGAPLDFIDGHGNTPLTMAAYWNRDNVARLLLEKGANVDFANKEGDTPLMRAVYMYCIETVNVLLAAGADIHLRNRQDESAYLMAVKGAHQSVDEAGTFLAICDLMREEEKRREAVGIQKRIALQANVQPLPRIRLKPKTP